MPFLVVGAAGILLSGGLLALATGGVAGMGRWASTMQVASAPLPPLDPSHVDAVAVYPAARALARSLAPSARLVGIEANVPTARGLVDLTAGATLHYEFAFDAPGDTGGIGVHVSALGMQATRELIDGDSQPLEEPRCPISEVWAAAQSSGLHRDANAKLRYGASAGASVWVFEVPNHPELTRKINGVTCRVVPSSP